MSRIAFAPDSFKGTASADEVARAMAEGWSSMRPHDEVVLKPMADGGEGTIDAFAAAVPGSRRMLVTVAGPDDAPVDADWLLLPDGTGVVELANTSGLTLLDALRPADAHTLGFGQAIRAALDLGVGALVLAIGGSASTDGGAGLLSELGARFLDADGSPIGPGNRGLSQLHSADLGPLRGPPPGGVTVLCDVTNPLLGESGAARVFGPQKGADTPALVAELEQGLARYAAVLGHNADVPGAGAAGGVGYGLMAWGASLVSGADGVARVSGLDDAIAACDVVVTGEGSYDEQSARGKVVSRVLGAVRASAATGSSVEVMLVAGRIAAPVDEFTAAVSLTELAGSASAARADARRWASRAGASLATGYSGN